MYKAAPERHYWLEHWRKILLTAVLIYMAGWLSSPLTWLEGNVGAIYPSAGIALGAVLLWGNPVLPGIYVAELLLHYENLFKADSSVKLVFFALAPLSNMLGAWLGDLLVKRFADFPNELVSLKTILLFLFWAGPVATIATAIFNVGGLALFGTLPHQDAALTFLTSWLATCLGIVVFTPLFFVAFNKSHRIWRQRALTLALPLAIIFLVVVTGFWLERHKEIERLHKLMAEQSELVKNGLEDEFRVHLAILSRYTNMTALKTLNEESFHANAKADLSQHFDTALIAWLKAVKSNPKYKLIEQFVETNPNSQVSEFNSISETVGNIDKARETITVFGERQYLIGLPAVESEPGSCDCVKGMAVGIFDIKTFMQDALWPGNYNHIMVKLKDNLATPKVETVFGFADETMTRDILGVAKLQSVSFGKQRWYLEVTPGEKFLSVHYSKSPWQLLLGGMFLTGFMSVGLLALTGHTELVAAQVDKRTLELNRSNLRLAARERQFRKLVQTQSAIVWRADPVTFRFVFVSAEAASILGYPIKQWLDEADFWQNHLHIEDKEIVLMNCALGRISNNSQSYDLEYRMIAADGHIVWLRDIATLVVEGDVITELYGFMIDITKQKHSEEQLRLAANTFESQQGIMITDKDATILRVNKAFTQITGYSAAQAIGSNPRILKSGRHDQAFFKNYWEQLLTKDKFEGEIWNRRQTGEIYPEWQTVTAVRDAQGDVSHFVSVFSDITDKKDAEDKIHNMAFYDALTNLPNRRLVLDRFDQELAIARRHRQFGAVLYLDLDHFKILNDSQGHLVGDELLIQVAGRLSSVLREEDTPARLGGDEFVVLLHANSESLAAAGDHAMIVAEKIRERLNTPFVLGQYQHQIGTSIGIALFPDGQENPDVVLQQADTAMYRSKSIGRNSISFFHASMQEAADLRLSLEQDLRGAIDQGRFILCYHPQMDAQGRLIGAEALIRWEDKIKGRLSPADFIPVAEESNLILTIGKWVLMEACSQIKTWEDDGLVNLPYLSVNVSSRQFRQQDFVKQVKHALDATGLAPSRLGIELTESIMIVDIKDTVDKMNALKSLGVTLAVDDFGTGYSSLVYLKQLPLDVLKIDREFVRDILSDSNDAVIVETIIGMAKHMNIKVIAEGVETAEQLAFLTGKGCAIFQGYYFDQPLSAANFAEKYLKKSG